MKPALHRDVCAVLTRRRRGSMLLEVMLALALFIGAAAAVLSIVGQAVGSLKATRERQHAVDLARSAMAELEAGIRSAETLSGPVMRWQEDGEEAGGEGRESGWELNVETQPTSFDGLSLVTVKAFRTGSDPDGSGAFALRQLVRLFARDQEGVGEKDDITREAEKSAAEAASRRPAPPVRAKPAAGGTR